jgi:hypothetical protein
MLKNIVGTDGHLRRIIQGNPGGAFPFGIISRGFPTIIIAELFGYSRRFSIR